MNYEHPHEIEDVMIILPVGIGEILPAYRDIPDEFKEQSNTWVAWASWWFFEGEPSFPDARPDIDANQAIRHLTVIIRAHEPDYQHKIAAIGYLASLWFESADE